MIETFTTEHSALHQITPERVEAQQRTLRVLEAWLGRPIAEITASDLSRWMGEQVTEGSAATTVRWRLGMVRPYLRWLRKRGAIPVEMWVELNEVKPPRGSSDAGRPNPYSRKDLDALWSDLAEQFPFQQERFVERFKRGTSPYRRVALHGQRIQYEAILALGLYQGMRRNEIFSVSIDDVHPDNSYIVVHGKREDHRDKVREVPYSEPAREAVKRWFSWRRVMAPPHDAVWLSLTYREDFRLTAMTEDRFYKLLLRLGRGWEFHRLRHTCATERLRAGMELHELQRFLGHATIQQTLRYSQLVSEDIERAVARTDADFIRRVAPR